MKKPLVIWASAVGALLAAGVTVGLTMSGPSATPAIPAAAAPQPTTATSQAPASKCTDFPVDSFLGVSAVRMTDIEGLGWTLTYDDADSQAATFQLGDATTDQIYKNAAKCTARVMVKIRKAPTAPPAPPAPAGPLTTVPEGTYLVGTDMEAGSYKTTGGRGCYWARLKDDAGTKIIANNLSDGPARFTAKNGEYVEISGCTFTKV